MRDRETLGFVVSSSAASGFPTDISYDIAIETGQIITNVVPATRPADDLTEIMAAPPKSPAKIVHDGHTYRVYIDGESIPFQDCQGGP